MKYTPKYTDSMEYTPKIHRPPKYTDSMEYTPKIHRQHEAYIKDTQTA